MATSNSDKNKSRAIWPVALIALVAVIMRLPDLYLPMNRDSGLFAYGGWRILHGALPYLNFWDNKLPGVFYINALAIRLFGASQMGLVLFQMVYGALTAVMFFAVASKITGRRGALAAALVFAVYQASYGLQEDGNYTEGYALLPVLLSVYIVILASGKREKVLNYLLAGVLGAAAVIIKQPAGAVIPAFVIYALLSRNKPGWKAGAWIVIGAASVVGLLLFWMNNNGILKDAIDANVVFNKLYFIDSYTYGLPLAKMNALRGLNMLALPFAGAVLGMLFSKPKRIGGVDIRLLLIPWFVFDIAGIAMGGRFANHYFITILPSSMLLTALFIDRIKSKPAVIALGIAGIALFIGPIWSKETSDQPDAGIYSSAYKEYEAVRWVIKRRFMDGIKHPSEEVAEWVKARTKPSDTIYIWCWDTRIAFLAQREIPSRYVHTHPLGATGFNRDTRIRELARDLENRKPKYIIDGSPILPTTAPSLGEKGNPPSTCPFFRLDGYEPVKDVVADKYKLVKVVAGYPVYQLK